MILSKKDLIDGLVENPVLSHYGVSKASANRFVDAFVDYVESQVANGNEVRIMGFGKFRARKHAARNGRNPQTGDEIVIPAGVTPSFTAGRIFKDKVNQ